eukprot:CAMPEP_0115289562 /NCGR_PEP_ID=MMETSP0270-20121206/63575_1 /TAXON_ID=71861 /ORGANISM="Scrippsiella trochoidea, Strain CCMP3099" /LENGTH=1481 /DNA_ID=CAMNT_0002706749 /DNA_START=54 /DNA_END=4496 /DNA_ORIENTATION=-
MHAALEQAVNVPRQTSACIYGGLNSQEAVSLNNPEVTPPKIKRSGQLGQETMEKKVKESRKKQAQYLSPWELEQLESVEKEVKPHHDQVDVNRCPPMMGSRTTLQEGSSKRTSTSSPGGDLESLYFQLDIWSTGEQESVFNAQGQEVGLQANSLVEASDFAACDMMRACSQQAVYVPRQTSACTHGRFDSPGHPSPDVDSLNGADFGEDTLAAQRESKRHHDVGHVGSSGSSGAPLVGAASTGPTWTEAASSCSGEAVDLIERKLRHKASSPSRSKKPRDYWLQIEKLTGLPIRDKSSSFVIKAKFASAQDSANTEVRKTSNADAGPNTECVVKQQMFLACDPTSSVIEVTVLEIIDNGKKEKVVGFAELDAADRVNQKSGGKAHAVRDSEGLPTGFLLKLRVKKDRTQDVTPAERESPQEPAPHDELLSQPTLQEQRVSVAHKRTYQHSNAERAVAVDFRQSDPSQPPLEELQQGSLRHDRPSSFGAEVPLPPPASAPPQRGSLGGGGGGWAPEAEPEQPKQLEAPMEVSVQALEAISRLLDENHMRISDIFRSHIYNPSYAHKGDEYLDASEVQHVCRKAGLDLSLEYNPSYAHKGDEYLDASEVQHICRKVGLDLSLKDVRELIVYLDADGNGVLDIDELEVALRGHRRGREVWKAADWQPRAMSPRRGARDASPRVVEMHNLHKQKLARFEKKKEEEEEREIMRIKHDAEAALPMRAAMKAYHNFDPHELCNRLYKEHKDSQVNRRILQQKFEDEEAKKLEHERTRPRPPSAKPKHEIDRFYEGIMDWEDKRRKNIEKAQENKIHQEKKELDLVGRNAMMRSLEEKPWQRLHEDAKKRSHDLKNKQLDILSREEERLAPNMVGPPKGTRGANLEHINKLFLESEEKAKKISGEVAKLQSEEVTKRKEEARKAMSPTALSRSQANSKLRELPAHRDPLLLKDQEPDLKTPRRFEPLEPMGHILLAINAAAAQRCACAPEDPQSKGLAAVGLSLKEAMSAYQMAAAASDGAKRGCSAYLKSMKSQSLHADGQLMEDEEGFRRCCAPDPIRQLTDDFESLLTAAQRAQAVLLMTFIDAPKNFQELDRRWPIGTKHSCARAAPSAAFAYNPGPKSKQAACKKAQVQFGPSEGPRRFMHLLDLARLSLVFKDSSMLRTGLEHILDRFEVVQVRNHYQPQMQGLLGERWVEVLVVLKDGLTFPIVCEIRLEEESFFDARMKADEHVEKVCQGIRDLYAKASVSNEAIQYFIKWSLHRPKEIHALTVFRRQLSRRHGSSIVAWRRLFGTATQLNFNSFRETCGKLNVRDRTVEFWQELDPTRSGRISLFEVDQEGIVLLAKLLGRILALDPDKEPKDGEEMFQRLTTKAMMKVMRPGHMDCHEFRTACKPLGFNPTEADRMFSSLDAHGGCQSQPPTTICVHDLAWLRRLPCFVDLPSVTLAEPSFDSDFERKRFMEWAEAGLDDDYQRPRVPTTSMTTSLQRQ